MAQRNSEAWDKPLRDGRVTPGSQFRFHLAAFRLHVPAAEREQGTKSSPFPSNPQPKDREEATPGHRQRTKDQKNSGACCQVPAGIAAKGSLREGNGTRKLRRCLCRCLTETAPKHRGAGHGTTYVTGLHRSCLLPQESQL